MTRMYCDKNGQPLKGAALQSVILANARNAYFSRYPEQLAALKSAEGEDAAIIERSAIEAGTRILGTSQRREGAILNLGTILGASCTAGLLALLIRPAFIPHALILGTGIGSSVAISRTHS